MEFLGVVGALLSALAGVAGFMWWFSDDQVARRAMRATPLRRIRDVREGERVRVVGQAQIPRPITAPLSGRPCAAWRVVVEQKQGVGQAAQWETLVDEHEVVEFFLRDWGDSARVDVTAARPVLEQDGKFVSGFLQDAGPELEAFLAERGHSSKGRFLNRETRYREGVVEPGETVAVVGIGRLERDPEAAAEAGDGYRDARIPARVVLVSPDDGPLLISDEPAQLK